MIGIRGRIRAAFLILACLLAVVPAGAGTLLPNGMQYFTDNNGLPLSAGCVYFYIPGTNAAKDTYTTADQTTANTNPVQLDAAGRAIIYGTGVYRQVVKASPCGSGGVTIWDQITADTASTITIFAGASSGTPNAITVNATEFSGIDGQVINFISTNTNSAAATLNPSGFGAIQIVRDSATGPGALSGGELVATNAVSVIYDATAGTFHILSPITWPNTSGVPVGTTIAVSGFNAPTNFAFAYGQAVSRTTYSNLFTAYTSAQTGSMNVGSAVISGLSDTSQFGQGLFVEALGIVNGTQINSCTSTTCTLSANATLTRTGTVTFFAYGPGDGTTTFNLPDYRGRSLVGRDNIGGTPANVTQVATTLTTTSGSQSATVASGAGLAAGMYVIGNPNVPPGTLIGSISGTNITLNALAIGTQSAIATRFSLLVNPQALGVGGGAVTKGLVAVELPAHTHANTLTDPGHTHGATSLLGMAGLTSSGGAQAFTTGGFGSSAVTSGFSIDPATTGISINNASTGSNQVFGLIGPVRTVNWAVRLVP